MRVSELSPRAQEIVASAREVLEDAGPSGLSMRALADRLGIRAPSIYKHLADKQALENAVISAGFEEFAAALEAAQAEDDPVGAFAAAYRRYATEHPHLYRLMTEHPLQRDALVPGAEDRASARIDSPLGPASSRTSRAEATISCARGLSSDTRMSLTG